MPIACLCLAALAAVAIACVSETLSSLRLVAGWRPRSSPPTSGCPSTTRSVADEGNAVYRVAAAPPGRLLEVPPLPPDAYAGSVYLYYAMQAPRERPLGYATSAPPEAFRTARLLAETRATRQCCAGSA